MGYKQALSKSQAAFVDDIVGQIPEDHGARAAFIMILDELAGDKLKFQFYVVDLTEGEVVGTNDGVAAGEASESDEFFVIDAKNNLWLQADDSVEITEIVGS